MSEVHTWFTEGVDEGEGQGEDQASSVSFKRYSQAPTKKSYGRGHSIVDCLWRLCPPGD